MKPIPFIPTLILACFMFSFVLRAQAQTGWPGQLNQQSSFNTGSTYRPGLVIDPGHKYSSNQLRRPQNSWKEIKKYGEEYAWSTLVYLCGAFASAIGSYIEGKEGFLYYGSMIGVSLLPPLIIHSLGKSTHPNGKYWHGLIGSLASTALWEVAIFLGTKEMAKTEFMAYLPLYVLPVMGLGPVLSYNLFSKAGVSAGNPRIPTIPSYPMIPILTIRF